MTPPIAASPRAALSHRSGHQPKATGPTAQQCDTMRQRSRLPLSAPDDRPLLDLGTAGVTPARQHRTTDPNSPDAWSFSTDGPWRPIGDPSSPSHHALDYDLAHKRARGLGSPSLPYVPHGRTAGGGAATAVRGRALGQATIGKTSPAVDRQQDHAMCDGTPQGYDVNGPAAAQPTDAAPSPDAGLGHSPHASAHLGSGEGCPYLCRLQQAHDHKEANSNATSSPQ